MQAHPINCFNIHAERLWAGRKQKGPMKNLRDRLYSRANCGVVTKGSLNISDGNEMNYDQWGEEGCERSGCQVNENGEFPCGPFIPHPFNEFFFPPYLWLGS
jgi:hypothetical protein